MCELYVRAERIRSVSIVERTDQGFHCFKGTVCEACQLAIVTIKRVNGCTAFFRQFLQPNDDVLSITQVLAIASKRYLDPLNGMSYRIGGIRP